MPTHTYNKTEKLKSRKLIEQVFVGADAMQVYPLRLLYKQVALPQGNPLQATVSVSKRSFKKAVDRNRVKRLIREAYRLQKLPLQQKVAYNNKQMVLFFIYTAREIVAFAQVEKAMMGLLKKLDHVAFKNNQHTK